MLNDVSLAVPKNYMNKTIGWIECTFGAWRKPKFSVMPAETLCEPNIHDANINEG